MNKAYTKAIVHGIHGLNTAKSIQMHQKDRHDTATIASSLKFPLFIKPNNGGSSVGMSKVYNVGGLQEAIDKAFQEDSQILIEEFIKGREFSIGIARLNGKITVLPATEILTTKDFFDYEAKYTTGVTDEVTPADLPAGKNQEIAEIVTQVYLRLNCRGMVRVDFILLEDTQEFYFIEINTTPGQSANSLIPQQVRAAGMSVQDFYGQIIEGTR
jgi:D-alanine-D-alanine ligase